MGKMSFFEKLISSSMAEMHCGYIGKVLWTDGNTAKIQPLGMSTGSSVVSSVPIACRYKIASKKITYTDGSGSVQEQEIAVPEQISKGDLVACLCADRDITEARRGRDATPPSGYHNISDSIIVGIL